MIRLSIITYNWHANNSEIKDVPWKSEKVLPQSYHFNDGFDGENSREDHVEDLEHVRHFFRLLVVLNRHGYHIQDDEEEDKYFKPV